MVAAATSLGISTEKSRMTRSISRLYYLSSTNTNVLRRLRSDHFPTHNHSWRSVLFSSPCHISFRLSSIGVTLLLRDCQGARRCFFVPLFDHGCYISASRHNDLWPRHCWLAVGTDFALLLKSIALRVIWSSTARTKGDDSRSTATTFYQTRSKSIRPHIQPKWTLQHSKLSVCHKRFTVLATWNSAPPAR
jgi:hypothetical protein